LFSTEIPCWESLFPAEYKRNILIEHLGGWARIAPNFFKFLCARCDNDYMRLKHMSVIIVLCLLASSMGPATAAAKVFKNCTELNKIYPGGVALPGAINAGGATKKEPKYNKALYNANKKSDRDKDGIACEK
jgi:hypothetical protein